jgi:hypothetical protein
VYWVLFIAVWKISAALSIASFSGTHHCSNSRSRYAQHQRHHKYSSSRPTKTRIDPILQIEFCLNRPDDSPMINVHARNTCLNEEYLWRSMPSTYESNLQRAPYKLGLLKMVAARTDIDRLHYLSALKYLVYIDKTLDRIWEEV